MPKKLLLKLSILTIALITFKTNILAQKTYDDYLDEGMELMRKGQFKEAIPTLNKATKIYPEDFTSYYLRGQCYIAQKKWDNSISDFNIALERGDSIEDRAIAKTYYFIGYCHLNKKDTAKGLVYADKCLKLNPTHYEALVFRIFSYTNKKMFNKAKPYIDRAIKQYPDDKLVLYYYGFYLFSLHKNVRALNVLEKSYRLGYRDDEFLNTLGTAYYRLGKLSKALMRIDDAIAIAPNKNYYYIMKGIVLYDMKFNSMALDSFNKALELGAVLPKDAEIRYRSIEK